MRMQMIREEWAKARNLLVPRLQVKEAKGGRKGDRLRVKAKAMGRGEARLTPPSATLCTGQFSRDV